MNGLATTSRLRELKRLPDEGVLTREEFNEQKAKVLAADATERVRAAAGNTARQGIGKINAGTVLYFSPLCSLMIHRWMEKNAIRSEI